MSGVDGSHIISAKVFLIAETVDGSLERVRDQKKYYRDQKNRGGSKKKMLSGSKKSRGIKKKNVIGIKKNIYSQILKISMVLTIFFWFLPRLSPEVVFHWFLVRFCIAAHCFSLFLLGFH